MDGSVLRAVVLMNMLVLSMAQADTNAGPNDNPLGQVDDISTMWKVSWIHAMRVASRITK
ncbi:hypothetical protein Pyn_01145 [Prunus yedoensis var. nudiflora]|uniref:Uncharacterized protein n=1 Tax=Prunus yedoensis var. nudiflora TaxID=2094558 RepID=A0A314XM13_PRUYE|nr:hypothetical protein Pyn_01145 [Prunus yedoensis var. nudiflora]